CDALGARAFAQRLESKVEGGKGKSVGGIDGKHRGAGFFNGRDCEAVNLAGSRLGRIGRNAAQTMSALSRKLRFHERAGNRGGVRLRRAGAYERVLDERVDLRRRKPHLTHAVPSSSAMTFSATTWLTRTFDSSVTPAICGVSTRLGMPANFAPASAVSGSVSNTSRAAPPILPAFSASATACSSTMPPRAALIRMAPGRMRV